MVDLREAPVNKSMENGVNEEAIVATNQMNAQSESKT